MQQQQQQQQPQQQNNASMNLQQEQQQQQEQQPGGAGVNDRFNSGVSASGNRYAAQQNNNAYAQQGYYYHDIGQQQQQQYADASYAPQAYQQQLAYAGVSASQPYWYAAPYGEGGSTPAVQTGNPQELSLRDRDVKTQRRKEANRESARRSKQRKKEESELLSSKAQELVRESACLRSELEKIQKQADKLYNENVELRTQVAKAGGSLPPSPERIVPITLPPPIELPASLLKEVGNNSSNTMAAMEKNPSAPAVPRAEPKVKAKGEDVKREAQVNAMPAIMRAGEDDLGEGHVDLPSLLENELTNREVSNNDQFAQLPLPSDGSASYPHLGTTGGDAVPNDMLMSEAIVSFREPNRDSLFSPSPGIVDDDILAGALRNPQHFGNSKSLDTTVEDFSLIRQSDTGQGG